MIFDAFGLAEPPFPDQPGEYEVRPDPGEAYIDNLTYTAPDPPAPIQISSARVVGPNLQLVFSTPFTDRAYEIQQTANLVPSSLTTVGGVTFTSAGTTMTAIFPKPAGPAQFFRVHLP